MISVCPTKEGKDMAALMERPQHLEIPTDFNSDIVHYVDTYEDPDKALCGKYVGSERWAEEDVVDCIVCRDLIRSRAR
jgi:hypothetical protein